MNDYWKLALLAAGIAATGGLLAAPAAAAAAGGAGAAGAAGAGAAGAGGLLAAEGAGAAAAGSGAAGAGGLLGAEGLAALGAEGAGATALGTEGAAAGMAAPEMLAAQQAAAPVVDMSTQAGMFDTVNAGTNGLLGRVTDGATAAGQYMKPVGQAMSAANTAKGLFGSSQPQMQPAQSQMRSTPMNLDGVLQQGQQNQQTSIQDQMRRRQQMQALINQIGGR